MIEIFLISWRKRRLYSLWRIQQEYLQRSL